MEADSNICEITDPKKTVPVAAPASGANQASGPAPGAFADDDGEDYDPDSAADRMIGLEEAVDYDDGEDENPANVAAAQRSEDVGDEWTRDLNADPVLAFREEIRLLSPQERRERRHNAEMEIMAIRLVDLEEQEEFEFSDGPLWGGQDPE
jgi:hypothetical protein